MYFSVNEFSKPTGKLYNYNGKKVGLMELSRNSLCKVSAQVLKNHMDEGMSIEEAFKRKKRNHNSFVEKLKYGYDNKELTVSGLFNLPECVLTDINQLRHRLSGGDFTVKEAILIPINGRRKNFNFNPNKDKPAKICRSKEKISFNDLMRIM